MELEKTEKPVVNRLLNLNVATLGFTIVEADGYCRLEHTIERVDVQVEHHAGRVVLRL